MKEVTDLHQAYCDSLGINLHLNHVFQRWWYDAQKLGVTPDDIYLCIKHRLAFNQKGHAQYGTQIKHLVGDEESIASTLNEAASVRASIRKKAYPPGKIEVLKATGRPTEPETKDRHISEVFRNIQKQ